MPNLIHKKLFSNHFSKQLLSWNRKSNKREMPWKGEKDPYKIWLSEIILQQTRVEQGLKYYESFVFNFPSIEKLANTDKSKIFKLWEGLGYYSRCRNLIATAKLIANENGGIFPSTFEEILKLKGVGPYTAAAIASFAFNLPYAVVDGNVFRVLARIFGIEIPIDSTEGKKYFTQLANDLLDKETSGEYNQAIMDFGATVCKPLAPLCEICVFKKGCHAFKTGTVSNLPIKQKKIAQKTRFFYYFLIEHKNKIAVRERIEKDIWRHLYEFPLIEANKAERMDLILATAEQNGWINDEKEITLISEIFRQKLTHQTINGIFIEVKAQKNVTLKESFEWMRKDQIKEIAFPKMINEYLSKRYL